MGCGREDDVTTIMDSLIKDADLYRQCSDGTVLKHQTDLLGQLLALILTDSYYDLNDGGLSDWLKLKKNCHYSDSFSDT